MSSPTPTIKEIAPLEFIINVQMTIKKSDTAAFLAITQETNNLALAEPSCVFFNFGRREPINDLTFEPLEQGDGDEVVFWWSEGWSCDLKWFREVQFRREYYGPHMKAVEPMWVKPGECLFLCSFEVLRADWIGDCLAVFEIYRPEQGGCLYKEGM
jgi:hypothetical protein